MRRFTPGVLALLLASACRDLTIPAAPPPPGPGAVYGRVVVSVPGRSEHQPAAGATVALLSSSLSTTAGNDGLFRLDGLDETSGALLFRYATGTTTQQRLLDLSDIGAGPGRQIALGDVLVVDNASLHGVALRADIPGNSGHGGTVIFVPQGPFTTYTGDDGTYVLENLPEGTIQLAVFHDGYAPVTRDNLELRSGEDFPMQAITLQPATVSAPGFISGTVRFSPTTTDAASTQVSAAAPGGTGVNGSVTGSGDFTVAGLPPGVYALTVAHAGYTSAVVNNVLVFSDAGTQVSDVLLTQGAAFDAGMPPPPPDAGPMRGDAGFCSSSAQCGAGQWCDPMFGACRVQCGSLLDCSNGRVCDVSSGTCEVRCAPGCPLGQTCDSASQTCRVACDVSTPCPSGFACSPQNVCVHECAVTADCTQAHRMCQAGACVSDGTCSSDLDCPATQLCAGTACSPRTTPLTDAGAFSCVSACDCRFDEACESGACVPAQVPTRFLTADGGGLGLTPSTPSSDVLGQLAPHAVLALRAGDEFDLSGPLGIDAGMTIAGGYIDCGPARWVRNSDAGTTLTVPHGPVILVNASPIVPLAGVTIENLALEPLGSDDCQMMLRGFSTQGLELRHISSAELGRGSCPAGSYTGVFECDHCDGLDVDDLVLTTFPANMATGSGQSGVAHLTFVSGALKNVSAFGLSANVPDVAIDVTTLTGPLMLSGGTLGPPENAYFVATGISATQCAGFPLTVDGFTVYLPNSAPSPEGIDVSACENVTLTNNRIDGSKGVRTTGDPLTGIRVSDSGGVIDGNTVILPVNTGGSNANGYTGIQVNGPHGPSSISGNTISGGTYYLLWGIGLDAIDSGGLHVEKNVVTLGSSGISQGLHVLNVAASAGLVVRDNQVSSGINQAACGSANYGLYAGTSSGLFERNRFFAPGSDFPIAVQLIGPGQIELYENHVWAGRTWHGANCGGPAIALSLAKGAGQLSVYATGNTLDGDGDPSGIDSDGVFTEDGPLLFMTSNLVNGGRTSNATMLAAAATQTGGPYVAARFDHNYFYVPPTQSTQNPDYVTDVATSGTGVADSNGNTHATVGCFDLTQPTPWYRLAAGTACLDKGVAGKRVDASAITLDVDMKPRVLGAAADIGCSEKQ